MLYQRKLKMIQRAALAMAVVATLAIPCLSSQQTPTTVRGSRVQGWYAVNLAPARGLSLKKDNFDATIVGGKELQCTEDQVLGASIQGFALPTHLQAFTMVMQLKNVLSNTDAQLMSMAGINITWNSVIGEA